MTAIELWTSLLFVPAHSERLLHSAIRHRPDAIILDLEDAVAPAEKATARSSLAKAQAAIADAAIDCVVRVNAPLVDMVKDLEAIERQCVSAILIPKVESRRAIENANDLIGANLAKIALVETPAGVERLPIIADTAGLRGLMLGSEDLSAALGVSPDDGVLDLPAARLAMCAAQFDLLAIGFPGSIGNFKDLELYRRQLERGRKLGMHAVAAIHPTQLPIARDVMKPTEFEIEWAQSVTRAVEVGGKGAIALDGMMIDAPVLTRARRIIHAAAGRVDPVNAPMRDRP